MTRLAAVILVFLLGAAAGIILSAAPPGAPANPRDWHQGTWDDRG